MTIPFSIIVEIFSNQTEESWYDARYLVSDRKLYDLESVSDIRRIPIPNFDTVDGMQGYGVTGSLDYVLRMKAGNLHRRNETALCSACLWKATEMMFASGIPWKHTDYDRIITWHYELGQFEEAEKAKKYLKQHTQYTENQFDLAAKKVRDKVFSGMNQFGQDLVAFHDYGHGCCSKCAPMRDRVYSISGKNKFFPRLPKYPREHGNFHKGCRCVMSPYWEDHQTIYFRGQQVNAVEISQRPWIDDRTQEEIEKYNSYLTKVSDESKQQEMKLQFSFQKGLNRKEFEAIQQLFPDKAPKSLAGYTRMKNSQTKNFIKLASLAEKNGIAISQKQNDAEN